MEAEKIQSFIRKHGFLRATSQLTLTCSFCQNLLHFWLPSPTASLTICGLDVSVRATPDLLCNGYRTRVRDVLCETQLWGTGLSSPAQDWLLVLSEPWSCRQIPPCGILSQHHLLHDQWSLSLGVLEHPGSHQPSGGTESGTEPPPAATPQSCSEPSASRNIPLIY